MYHIFYKEGKRYKEKDKEKDGDDEADTVGCCSLRVEHIQLLEPKKGKDFVINFNFLSKDSI